MNNIIGIIFIAIGLAFDFFGCLGLVRLPDVYNRLQASTKCITFGTCLILLGMFITAGLTATGIKAVLCAAFLLLASPTATHVLARAAHKFGIKLSEGSTIDDYEKTQN
ncbi:MAG: monovalent cation/H(+) antiporter subunit G [Candidatus Omnitrophica bacterium]|nr:monovalent cation/H(+) antiporter subunit G [Candidatus Omnitrophota bacterium]